MQPNKKRQVKLALPKDPSAAYANTVMISHTNNEVIFDFIQMMPNDTHARIQKRIVMTAAHAKLFLNALTDNIDRFEEKHGEIELPQRPSSLADQLFRGLSPDGDNNDDSE